MSLVANCSELLCSWKKVFSIVKIFLCDLHHVFVNIFMSFFFFVKVRVRNLWMAFTSVDKWNKTPRENIPIMSSKPLTAPHLMWVDLKNRKLRIENCSAVEKSPHRHLALGGVITDRTSGSQSGKVTIRHQRCGHALILFYLQLVTFYTFCKAASIFFFYTITVK